MADTGLKAISALDGFDKRQGSLHLAEVAGLAIVSLAVPLGTADAATAALKKAYGVAMPAVGHYVTSSDGKVQVIGTAPDQMFVMLAHAEPDARDVVHSATGGAFYSTDQTDVWCTLELTGPGSRAVLARICPLDLHPDAFGSDAAARTVMEHMGAMIMRTGDDAFRLMSARSSAQSFLHAVKTSIDYVT